MGMEKQKGTQKRKHQDTNNIHSSKKVHKEIKNVLNWDAGEVSEWLESKQFGADVIARFIGENVTGEKLNRLTVETLDDFQLDVEEIERHRLLQELDILRDDAGTSVSDTVVQRNAPLSLHRTPTKYMPKGEETKVFNDPIHGHVELHPLCVSIIDTPQFQRLRSLKQLGGCCFVFPGASHNRFEHCIGVSHLAGQLVRALQHRQPELKINDKDILCVEIAGLCHDLGHGPFSHMFDGRFIPQVCEGTKWKHETASVEMFQHLVAKNELEQTFQKFGLYDRDLHFIVEQINGPTQEVQNQGWPYKGRNENKSFLYEIVANKRNGIDVDKWDYFARDSYHLGIKNNFDHSRFMKFVRVLHVDGQTQICSRDKEVNNLYDMFHTRYTLHDRAYKHKVCTIIEEMISEAFIAADPYLTFYGHEGKELRLSQTISDMEAYTQVTDHVFYLILYSRSKDLEPARKILQRIERRDLYKCVGQTKPRKGTKLNMRDEETFRLEMVTSLTEEELGMSPLEKDDLVLRVVDLDYGMQDENPLDKVRFYNKSDPDKAIRVRREQVSEMLPDKFSDQMVRVYSKKTDSKSVDVATRCFQQWCRDRDLVEPREGDQDINLTPCKASEASTSHHGNGPMKALSLS